MDENKDKNNLIIATEYLDDYFAECEEHLINIRRNVITLDTKKTTEKKVLEELLRSFHTIKGLSGMVGFNDAEVITHSMEDYVRALRDNKIDLTSEGIDTLIEGIKTLEQVLSAQKTGGSIPPITDIKERVEKLLIGKPEGQKKTNNLFSELKSDDVLKINNALKNGLNIWQFRFIPSSMLADRGINVGVIRSRLNNIGEIYYAAPKITQDGGVAFEFILGTDRDESEFSPWKDDGLTWISYEHSDEKKDERKEEKGAITKKIVNNALPDKEISITPSNIVRVDLARLDELMQMVGELVISRARLDDSLKRIAGYVPEKEMDFLQETHLSMERQLKNLREGTMRIRMVPIGEVFERMQFVVRDLAREGRKRINLQISGQETEIDKLLVERMMDPMLHLVRNAVSHGIEDEDERIAKGKPPEGTIKLNAYTEGDAVVIEIEDDGQGIDRDGILSKAKSSGIFHEEDNPSGLELNQNILDILCTSGFSTREEADLASGRGLGMTIVKNAVEELGGSMSLETEAGQGTRFIIHLPLTLIIVDALIVSIGNQLFAIPQPSVREVIEIEMDKITLLENNELILYRGSALPLLRLGRRFNLPEEYGRVMYGLILGNGSKSIGVIVDKIHTRREIVVRAITDPLVSVKGIAGATELGDGKPVLILHAADLIQMGVKRESSIWNLKGGIQYA